MEEDMETNRQKLKESEENNVLLTKRLQTSLKDYDKLV
jgi:hypothetical protein